MVRNACLKVLQGLTTLILIILLFPNTATAQNEVAIGSTTTKSNAILWLNGNGSQGLILPVVTNKSSVSNPDKGMIVYDQNDNKVWYRNESTWVEVGGGGSNTTDLNLAISGNQLQLLDGTTVQSTVNIAGGTAVNGAFMRWNGSSWQYATLSDVNGTTGQVVGIQGKTVPTLPTTTQALVYDGAAWKFQPLTGTDNQTLTFASPNLSISNGNAVDLSALDKDAQTLTLTGSNLSISGGNAVTLPATGVTSVTAGSGLTGGIITTTGTINVDVGTTANKIVQLDGTGKLPAIDGSQLTNLPALVEIGDISGVVAGTGLTGGATSGSATLNVDVGTSPGKIVQLDGTGKLPAIDGSQLTNLPALVEIGDISSVVAGTGLTGGATSGSATLNVDVGTSAGKIVQLDGTGKLPAIDGSQLVNLPVSGDITEVIAGAGLTGGGTTGPVTLNLSNTGITPGLYGSATAIPQLTVDAQGRITGLSTFAPLVADGSITGGIAGAGVKIAANTITDANIASLNAGKITSGTLPTAQVPNLDASKITTGTLGVARIPNLDASKITTGSFATTQIPDLDASKITTGVIPTTQGGTGLSLTGGSINQGELLIGTGGAFAKANLTPGSGVIITNGAGSITLGVDAGTTANKIVQLDNSGRLPAVDGSLLTNIPLSGDITDVIAGTGLSGGGATGAVTLNLANTSVSPASYGSATAIPQITVDAQGRITSATNVTPADNSATNEIQNLSLAGTGTAANGESFPLNISSGTGVTIREGSNVQIDQAANVITINSVAGGSGTVTNVTGTAPVSVATGTTTPVISIAQAGTITDGYLSSTDWNTFNSKGNGTVTNVTGTAPITVATGTSTPVIGLANTAVTPGTYGSTLTIPQIAVDAQGRITGASNQTIPTAGAATTGLLSNADWSAFNSKGSGTVTSVTGTGPISVATGTTTPVISISQAGTLTTGVLSSADWNTFNTKQSTLSPGAGINITAGVIINTGDTDASNDITTSSTAGGDLSGTFPNPSISVTAGTGANVAAAINASASTINFANLTIPTANTGTTGLLSNSDWNIFNSKGIGSVTSVGLTMPSIFTVSGSPVTTTGSLSATLASQSAATVFAAPTGSAGAPSFRTLAAGDIPNIAQSQVTNLVTDLAGKQPQLNGTGLVRASGTTISYDNTTYLTSFSETDPSVTAINGLVKSNGITISAAAAGTDYVAPNAPITGGTSTKITYDAKGLVTSGTTLVAADIPGLDASKITTGALSIANGGTGAITPAAALTNLGALGTGLTSGNIFVGSAGNIATGVPLSGDATITNTGLVTLSNGPTTRTNLGLGSLATLSAVSSTEITDLSIVNDDVNAAAAIAGTKIAPAFGTQNISTSGTLTTGNSTTFGTAAMTWPAANAAGTLTNDGTGALTWASGSSGWGLTGNLLTNPATNYIGTGDAQDLVFKTAAIERMRLTTTGRIGIGVAAPTDAFELYYPTQIRFHLKGPFNVRQQIQLFGTDGTTNEGWTLSHEQGPSGSGDNAFRIQTKDTNLIAMDIDFATQNVGIKNTGPTEALDVTGNVRFSGALMPNNLPGTAGQVLTSNGAGAAPTWASAGSATGWTISGNAGTTTANFIGPTGNVPFNFRVNGFPSGIIDTTPKDNTAFGYNSFITNTNSQKNTSLGKGALYTMDSGNPIGAPYDGNNTAVGYHSLRNTNPTSLTDGKNNTAIGYLAGNTNITGYRNTFVGAQAGFTSTNDAVFESAAFGYDARVTLNQTMVFGSPSVLRWGFGTEPTAGVDAIRVGTGGTNGNGARLTIAGAWTNASDSTKKYNIKSISYGLKEILQLKPVNYQWKGTGQYDFGFLAQDLKKVVPEIVFGEEGQMTVSYGNLTAVLTKAMQEQQKEIEELKAKLKEKDERVNSLEGSVTSMKDELENIKRVLGMEAKAKPSGKNK